jgi:TRAP transporter TAXI family solute receptor
LAFSAFFVTLVIAAGWSCHVRETPAIYPIRLLIPKPVLSEDMTKFLADLSTKLPDVHLSIEPTAGPFMVVSALQAGRGDIGLAQIEVVYRSYRRGTSTDPNPHTSLRSIAWGGLSRLFIFVRRDGPVQSVYDLRGRRVAVAPAETGDGLLWTEVLRAHGLLESDLTIVRHPNNEMSRFFEPEQLDAMVMVGNFNPSAAIAHVDPTHLRILPLKGPEISALRSEYFYTGGAVVEPGEIPGIVEPVETLGANSVIICRADLPDDVVYQFVKQLYAAASTHNPLGLDPNSFSVPISLHPGAARYYRERQLLK